MLISKVKHLPQVDGILQTSSVKSNFIDTEIFETALEDADAVKEKINERDEESPFFKKLSEDIFHSLYKAQPEVYDKANVHESLKMEHDLLKDIISNDKFEKLRSNTAGDMFNSTLSLSTFQEKAYSTIQEWTKNSKENEELMNKMNEAIASQEQLNRLMEEAQYDPSNQDLQNQIEKAKQQVQQANQNVKQQADKNGGMPSARNMNSLMNGLAQALAETQNEVSKAADALDNFGLGGGASSGDGSPTLVPYEDKKILVDALLQSRKMKDISKQLGRVQSCVRKVGKKPSRHGHAVCDIGAGNNIKRTLSTEKVKLVDKDLEYDFYKRFLDKSLLEYKTQGTEEHKGPIVVCLDTSGSMSGARDNWAKAVAIALLQVAMKDKRDYRCIFFNSGVPRVDDFNKENYSLKRMIDMAKYFASGGTKFEPALRKALESIEESKYKKADVLFITDGDPDSYLKDDFKRKLLSVKESKGFKIQSILIGGTNKSYLQEFSDDIITMQDLNENNDLVSIFSKIQSKG